MAEKEGSEADDIASAAVSIDGHGLSANPHVSTKTSSIISNRKVFQSSWIQRLKPFGSSDRKKGHESTASRGHVWTHFSKDFSSSSKRLSKHLNYHGSSSSSLPDGVPSHTKASRDEEMHSPRDFSSNPIIPLVPSDEHLDKSFCHGSPASSWASDGLPSQSARPSRKEDSHSGRESSRDPTIPFVPSEEIHSRRGNSGNRIIPCVPLEGNTSYSSVASLRTWNVLSGPQNSFMKRPSSFAEDIVPSCQNRENRTAENIKEPCESSYTGICKSEDSSTRPFLQRVRCDKNTSTTVEEGNFGFLKLPRHPKSISRTRTSLKSVSMQYGENFSVAEAAHGEVHVSNIVQDNEEKQLCFPDEPSQHVNKVLPSESASCTDLNTSTSRPQESLVMKQQKLKDPSQKNFLESSRATSTQLAIVSKIVNDEPNEIIYGKEKHGVKENFGFLRFLQKSNSRNHSYSGNDAAAAAARDMENSNAVKSNAPNRSKTAVETSFVDTSNIGGSSIQNAHGPIDRSDNNLSQTNNKFFSEDVVAARSRFIDEPFLKEDQTSSDDYWSEWMEIWEKSTTPTKHDVTNSITESLRGNHILQEYHRPNLKAHHSIIDREKPGQFSSSHEQTYGKQLSGVLQQDCAIPDSAEKRRHCFYQGASGSGRINYGDIDWEQRFWCDDTSDLRKSCTIKEPPKNSGGQTWIRRWCSSISIPEETVKIRSFIPGDNRSSNSNWSTLNDKSSHNASQNIDIIELRRISSKNKNHVKVPPTHTSSTLARQAPQVLELGDFVGSQAGQAMTMVGNTAGKTSLLQRNGAHSVWACNITTTEMESGNDFTQRKFHLDMEDL